MSIQNFGLELDEALYQAASARAQGEGKTLEHILANLIGAYARGENGGGMSAYTVQRGDTLGRIANQVYGDANKYAIIQQANNLSDPGRIWIGQVLVIPAVAGAVPAPSVSTSAQPAVATPAAPTSTPTPSTPQVDPCAAIAGENYGTLPIVGPPTDRPAAKHGDINLALRGYDATDSTLALIDMAGPTDNRAPQLAGLFANNRVPEVNKVYRANNWDWGSNSRGGPVTDFEVSVAGFKTEAGETIHVPEAGYEIGQGYAVLVLYADQERITLKYTGEDSVVSGYAIHIDGVCTEPNLLALYEQMNSSGRGQLPALRAKQALGRARKTEIQVAIRDTGRFMDPRVRKDWWMGY